MQKKVKKGIYMSKMAWYNTFAGLVNPYNTTKEW